MSEVLEGFTIGVAADRRSEEQLSLLTGRGATCIHGPTMRTHALRPEGEIASATRAVIAARPQVVVANTGIGTRGWIEAASATGLGDELRAVLAAARVVARGPKAHGAAVAEGVAVDWTAPDATSASVLQHITNTTEPGSPVAVQNDGGPDEPLAEALRLHGYPTVTVPVYRWSLPADVGPAEVLVRAIVEGRVDAVTFTAAPQIDNLMAIATAIDLGGGVATAFRSTVLPVCVGEVCAARAHDRDFGDALVPTRPRLGAMVQTLTDALVATARPFRLAGQDLDLRGRTVFGGDEAVMLTGRERDTLLALLERPGSVRSKQDLLGRVWGAAATDTHVVEVTVGRLRRRLGTAGEGIETVMRRGYRASPE
ncbi:MAG: uroporphyrinogen-III synthase [Actinomycetota bacterium]